MAERVKLHIHTHLPGSEKPADVTVPMGKEVEAIALVAHEGKIELDVTAPADSEHRIRDAYLTIERLARTLEQASAAEDRRRGISRPTVTVAGVRQP